MTAPLIQVAYYPCNSRDLTHVTCSTIAEAVELVREISQPRNNRGLWPSMLFNDGALIWRASWCQDRSKARWTSWWSMSFPKTDPKSYYRTWAESIGEVAGVRYASHRAGYRASERAFARFVAMVEERITREAA